MRALNFQTVSEDNLHGARKSKLYDMRTAPLPGISVPNMAVRSLQYKKICCRL